MSTNFVEYLESRSLLASAAKTGTITVASAGTALSGSGTLFSTEAPAGSVIRVLDDTGIVRDLLVASVTNNTAAVVGASPAAITAKAYRVLDITTANPSYFIVNTALPHVAGVTGLGLMQNGGFFKFDYNENVLLETVSVRLPYQFTIAGETPNNLITDPLTVSFLYTNAAGTSTSVIPIGGASAALNLPFENAEFPVNQLIPPPAAAISGLTRWGISAVTVPNISMINAPSILNGRYLPIKIIMRVRHQTALT